MILFSFQVHIIFKIHKKFFINIVDYSIILFCIEPAISTSFPEDYLEKVKNVHSKGGYGSQGYGYNWKIEEAQKNLLRTHTTAVSARMLYRLMKKVAFKINNLRFKD